MPAAKRSNNRPAQPQGNPAVKGRLTVDDICEDLGITRRTFYEWRAKRKAPKCRKLPNNELRIDRAEYDRWLKERTEAA
jgi:excisionase family DNA binding protein